MRLRLDEEGRKRKGEGDEFMESIRTASVCLGKREKEGKEPLFRGLFFSFVYSPPQPLPFAVASTVPPLGARGRGKTLGKGRKEGRLAHLSTTSIPSPFLSFSFPLSLSPSLQGRLSVAGSPGEDREGGGPREKRE